MASPRPRRSVWLLVRLLLYVAAIAFIFYRGIARRPGRDAAAPASLPIFAAADSSLTLAGADLAPELIHRLVAVYQADYPRLKIQLEGGGTAQALEALANGRASVAFLNRPPSASEQQLIRSAREDTVLWFPVALGGMVFLRSAAAAPRPLRFDTVRRVLGGTSDPGVTHLYAPDPNLGTWDALVRRLGGEAAEDHPPSVSITFLNNEGAVIEAVHADTAAIGLVSSLNVPENPVGLVAVAVVDSAGVPSEPTDEAIASGRYPLHHYLYVACRARGGIQGSMFVTFITSDRGQRQLERTGFLPARRALREIHLTTHGVGGS